MLLSLALTAVLASSPEAAVREFYGAFASGNVEQAARAWTVDQRPAFRRAFARSMAVRCRTIHITGLTVVDERVLVDALETTWLAGYVPRTSAHNAVFKLRRDDDGRWQINEWHRREEDLADRWFALPDARERAALLHSEPTLRTPALVTFLCRRAVSLINRAEFKHVREVIDTAYQIADEWDDDASRALAHGTDSVYFRVAHDDWPGAARHAYAAVAAAERSNDPDALARALWRVARADDEDNNRAIAAARRAMTLAEDLEDLSIAASVATDLSHQANTDRELKLGLHYAVAATRYAEMTDVAVATFNATLYLAQSYAELGGYELAIAHYERALAIARAERFDLAQFQILFFLASCHWHLGRTEDFFRLTDEAMKALGDRACGDPAPAVLAQRAIAHIRQGNLAAAERDARDAIALGAACEAKYMQATGYISRAQVRLAQGRPADALADAEAAFRLHDVPVGTFVIAKALRAQGRTAEARAKLESVLGRYESEREDVADPQLRHGFLHHRADVYRELVDLLADMNSPSVALAAAETLKARVLREIRGSHVETPATGEQRRQARALQAELAAANKNVLASPESAASKERLARARLELQDFEARLSAARNDGRPRQAAASAAHPADVAVLEYVVGERRTIVFAITRGDDGRPSIEQAIIPIAQAELARRIDSWLRLVSQRSSRYGTEARALYDLLIAPVESQIAGRTLCIVPDGELWRVPFHALKTRDGRHLIERTPVLYAPSYAMLQEERTEARPSKPTLLALGNPNIGSRTTSAARAWHRGAALGALPDAEEEVRAIARLYGERARIHVGAAATEETLKRDSGPYRILHFATHGLLDGDAPLFSALLLASSASEDGLLEAREIAALDLDADLAILSACDTARGEFASGEGIVGLSWALMATGCPRMIGTQWRVSSAATSRLMIDFHRRLSKRDVVERVADDLRRAQLEMLRGGTYAHPYYWAGFVLIGRDW